MSIALAETRVWTPQQEAFFAAVEGDSHILCTAVAGSGKSTTAVEAIKHVPDGLKPGFCAFNKHIAEELQVKLAGQAEAMTLHSLGNRTVKRSFKESRLDFGKLRNLAEYLFPNMVRPDRSELMEEVQTCKQQGKIAEVVNKESVWIDRKGNQSPVQDYERKAWSLLKATVDECQTYDFDDMLYWPYVHKLKVEQFDFLIVDEAQDLNPLQQYLAKAATINGRLAIVGDPDQSIYLFTGADPESIPNLASELRNSPLGLIETPLTVTFRCPRSHVSLAQRLVPRIQAASGAIEGTIRDEQPYLDLNPGDLVICRKNAPLVRLTYKLVCGRRKARMKGRDIGKGMLTLIDKLKANSIQELIIKSGQFRDRELFKLEERKATEDDKQKVVDRYECLDAVACDSKTVGELRRFIEEVFDDNDSPNPNSIITLSSVHRAKGLEANNVSILEYDRMPLTWAKQSPVEMQQELNIQYVALTRAKKHLNLISKTN